MENLKNDKLNDLNMDDIALTQRPTYDADERAKLIEELRKIKTEENEKIFSEELDKRLLFSVEPGALQTTPKTVEESLSDVMQREVLEEEPKKQR